jgi:integrase
MRAKANTKTESKHITIKNGNIAVRIYRRSRKKGGVLYPSFDVVDHSGGKRKFICFASEQDAREKATEIADALASGQAGVLTLTVEDKASYTRALELLAPTGVALEVAASVFAEAWARLKGRSLLEAVDFYVQRHSKPRPTKTVQEVVDEMIEAKKKDGASAVYVKDLKFRLGKVAEAFAVPIASLDAPLLNGWLRSLDCGARHRNNYRRIVVTLIKFAIAQDYIPDDHMSFRKIDKARGDTGAIEFFSPEELVKLLVAAQTGGEKLKPGWNRRYADGPGLVPYLVLGGFAGFRTAEIERQRWEDFLWDKNVIRVTAAKGHTPKKRLVPMKENLKAWLLPLRKKSGPVCEYGRISDAIARLARRAQVEWKTNGLRHAYVTYRVEETQDVPRVSLECGNSPKMVFNNYRELTDAKTAANWFNILPSQAANLIPMPKAV